MKEHRFGWQAGMGLGVGAVVVMLMIGVLPGAAAAPGSTMGTAEASLQVAITVSPPTISAGTQFNVSAQVMNGAGPFTFDWAGVPNGCNPQPMSWWLCTLSSPGQYSVSVTVTNGTGASGSATQGFSVTSNSGNGNGNQGNSNGNNNNGNNGSNGFNLSAFGPLLFYGLIGGIIAFALLVALTVAVIIIAVTLRRLPKPPKGGMVCSTCQATAPAGSKFCPSCAAPLGPPKK